MAASNPNPTRITDEIWECWTEVSILIPGVRLGGIYASKMCYHNTVDANRASWPGAYCVQLPLDLQGPFDKARAIDLTMSTTEMIRRTGYLRDAAVHPLDNRLRGVREFIGTLNGIAVFCMIRDRDSGSWRIDLTRDASHLWHEHISFWTAYCNNQQAVESLVSVLSGETWDDWVARKGGARVTKMIRWNGGYWITDYTCRRVVQDGTMAQSIIEDSNGTVTWPETNGSEHRYDGWSEERVTSVFGPVVNDLVPMPHTHEVGRSITL